MIRCLSCHGKGKCDVCQSTGIVSLAKASEHPDCTVTNEVPPGAVRVEVSYVRASLLLRSMDGAEHAIRCGVLDPNGRAAMVMWFKRAGRVVSVAQSELSRRMCKDRDEAIVDLGYGN